MRRFQRAVAAGAVIAVALGVSACGGSGDDGKQAPDPTKAGAASCTDGKEGPGVTVTAMPRKNKNGNQEIFNSPIVAVPEAVWVVSDSFPTSTVQQADPDTGEPGRVVDLAIATRSMSRLAIGGGSLWQGAIEDDTGRVWVTRIDAQSGDVVGRLPIGLDQISAIGTAGEELWVFGTLRDQREAVLAKVDPATGSFLEQFPTGDAIASTKEIAFAPDRIWLAGQDVDGQGTLVGIDRATKEVHPVDLGDRSAAGLAFDGTGAWTMAWKSGADSELVKVGPDGAVQVRVPTGLSTSEGLQFDDGTVWLLGGEGRTSVIQRRDPATGKVLASTCSSVVAHNFAAADGVAWIAGTDRLARVEIDAEG